MICVHVLGPAILLLCWLVLLGPVLWRVRRFEGRDAAAEPVRALAEQVAASRSRSELESWAASADATRVTPVAGFRWFPLPHGVYVTLGLLVLDVATDLNTAWQCFDARHPKFGGLLLMAALASTGAELGSGALLRLRREVESTLSRGVLTDGLMAVLEHEQGTEALASILVSVYAMPFFAREPAQLLISVLSTCLSVWGVASLQHQYLDLRVPPAGASYEGYEGGDACGPLNAVEVQERAPADDVASLVELPLASAGAGASCFGAGAACCSGRRLAAVSR